jgi:tetratricopeptide (TPR) repeat protein
MKTTVIPLIGDPLENLYQLGLREKESFIALEDRVTKLLSTNAVLRQGQEIFSRAKIRMKKKDESFFHDAVTSYAQGLGIDPVRYFSFLSLFELAAHYGHVYPELKGLLPGCTSLLMKKGDDLTHSRLLDFPLLGIFEKNPRLYLWQLENRAPLLTYSCEGMAPLFFQGLHGSGMSFALHHKPGKSYHEEGQSIFQIAFESIMEGTHLTDVKKEIKKRNSMTKWSFVLLDKSGEALELDIDGPAQNVETYNLSETSPLIFTNIPIQKDSNGFDSFLKFSESRQGWAKDKLTSSKNTHLLDALTDVEDQKVKNWKHPAATLATVGAYHINLSKGYLDVKEGENALTQCDSILRLNLESPQELTVLKEAKAPSQFEKAWKRAARAQAAFDEGEYDVAYHELQMASALIPHSVWKEIFSFYIYVWDLKFVSNKKELSHIYKKVRELHIPEALRNQWTLLMMRLEKKLDLSPTVSPSDVSPEYQSLFKQETEALGPLFATWMKLLYPRMEILDIFSPHHK